jgi:hypothetical protein
MARLVGSKAASGPIVEPEEGAEGAEVARKVQTEVPAEPSMAVHVTLVEEGSESEVLPPSPLPSMLDILAAIGVDNAELQARIAYLLTKFPNGIPQQLLFDCINNVVSAQALYLKIGEVMVAAQQFSRTGKGPVGHASVEVV